MFHDNNRPKVSVSFSNYLSISSFLHFYSTTSLQTAINEASLIFTAARSHIAACCSTYIWITLSGAWDDIMINTGARKQRVMARQGHVFFPFSSLDREAWSWWLQLIIRLIWEPAAAAELCPLFTIIGIKGQSNYSQICFI